MSALTPNDPGSSKLSAFEQNLLRQVAQLTSDVQKLQRDTNHQMHQLRGVVAKSIRQWRRTVIGDGDSEARPVMQRLVLLEKAEQQRAWTLKVLVTSVTGLVCNWIYHLLVGSKQ